MRASDAVILRTTRLTDTSLIVHWLTAEHGLVKTVAKGALRPKSAFAGRLDLFFSGEIVVQPAKRGELHHLREVSIAKWRQGLRASYLSTLMAGYCCRLLEHCIEPEHPEPLLHDLLSRALDHVDAHGASLRALAHFERELAKNLGIHHAEKPAEDSLREILGFLPPMREELLERLA